ncbi:MAG: bifunctional (p)ppGpp synthetase/guanosine-3',5'-bis(diphosphate) 3'-pyrophosphohydrolase [Candidatus Pacebacteria bacterium]|nr:bifunctional (p)ppGpp synthetase/guanosine-3',5'-bis(diphosphate) 3'-pyrophosphohydrolase [Candidatus Paceibacterota bacterium]MBP9840435.1 bifunctional (p)ppGpp synthetase/guanosine-3',5'-bis(diphosphate) 3'-pyrophosphohydrolase [Candidatus Paceibacterota bacterium]
MTSAKEIVAAMRSPSAEDIALITKAYEFGKRAHEGHARYSGEPYFVHPSAVAKHLAEFGMDAPAIAAGLLHDSIEDAKATSEEVEREFGKEVLFLVEGVTKLGKHKYRGAERHAESLRRLLVATSADIRVLIVKLLDRFHNMTTIEHVPEEKRKRIAMETLEIYAPIADRLGMGRIKKQLEDMAFPYVDPDAYAHAVEVRKLKTKENEEGLARIQKALQKELAKRGVTKFKTEIRTKGLWSLHQKLKRKHDDITKIHDIAALRVIVPTVDDCYLALGVIHSLWKPLPGEFKDYIAFPKPNGYQSLHTTTLTAEAGIVEMQVRTEEMHQRAQFGIASHLSYKQLGKGIEKLDAASQKSAFERLSLSWIRGLIPSLLRYSKKPTAPGTSPVEIKDTPQWLRDLRDGHAGIEGSEEFIEGLKEDFFSHRVFVFTPRGDAIDLPYESTPVDFAYAIHSDLGNHMNGAKINGKLVSLDTKLRNGDQVEIMTRDSAHPTKKWLEYAKTSLAKRHIRLQVADKEHKVAEAAVPRRRAKKRILPKTRR